MRSRQSIVAFELENILRQVGRRSADVHAALIPAPRELPRGRHDAKGVATFLSEGVSVCKTAFQSYRRYTPAQRASLRGFSQDLLAVSAERLLALDAALRHSVHEQSRATSVRGQIVSAVNRCRGLCEQGIALVRVVSGEGSADLPEKVEHDAASVAARLRALARQSKDLLFGESTELRRRSRVFSLDEGYVRSLEDEAKALDELLSSVATTAALEEAQAELAHAFAVAAALVLQIASAFDLAHRVDAAVAPLANANALRRASTMAPPNHASALPIPATLPAPGAESPAPRAPTRDHTRRVYLPRETLPAKK